MVTPYSLRHLEVATSTQDLARDGYRGVPTAVIANHQTAGRGRSGRTWQSAPRSLQVSLAFEPAWPPPRWGPIPLMAGLAAGDVLDVKLKWPNDLIVNSAKAGGILVEASGSVVVVGWGVNLWWPGAPAGITALREHDPGPQWGAELARSILESFLQRMTRDPGDWGIEQYRRSCLTLGTRVSWEQDDDDRPNHGVAVGIADDGALLVETTAGPVSLRSGEVRSLRGES